MNLFIKNAAVMVGLMTLEAIQATVLLGVVLGLMPMPFKGLDALLPESAGLFRPEWEGLLFVFFGVVLCAGVAGISARLKEKINIDDLWQRWRFFIVVEIVWTVFILSALEKTIFYDFRPQMAQAALFILLGAALLSKIFFDRLTLFWQKIVAMAHKNSAVASKRIGFFLGLAVIVLVIWIPHPNHVLGRIYVGDQFHHMDMSLMAPGWAVLHHRRMDVEAISQYGIGLPKLTSSLAHVFGGFDYLPMFQMMVGVVLVYYCLFFLLCARVFESVSIAVMVVLWGLRTQIFHPGVYPFYFTYPSTTALRFIFDVFVFLCLLMYGQKRQDVWLICAGAISGIAIWYMDSTGVFLTAAYGVYLWGDFFLSKARTLKWMRPVGLSLLPLGVAFFLIFLSTGSPLFSADFWRNALETVDYFLSGIGTYPMNESFKYHNFGAGLMGFLIPLVYVASILVVASWIWVGRLPKKDMLMVAMCCYGLGLNHYYIARSLLTCYYVTGLPFMFVCGYWMKILLEHHPKRTRWIAWGIAISLYALLTNHNFLSYPNLLNTSTNPMTDMRVSQPLPTDGTTYFYHLFRREPEENKVPVNSLGEKDEKITDEISFNNDEDLARFYQQDFDFKKDAALINQLTKPNEPVAVISDFEVKILIQSKRPPFFYYFPLINSRPKHMRLLGLAALHTNTERYNKKAIDQIKNDKPAYVFIEKVFLNDVIPKPYLDNPDQMMTIVNFVKAHYTPSATGEYLVAFKRKEQ